VAVQSKYYKSNPDKYRTHKEKMKVRAQKERENVKARLLELEALLEDKNEKATN